MSQKKIIILDDDDEFLILLKTGLLKLGLMSETFQTVDSFFLRLEGEQDIGAFFIDMHLGGHYNQGIEVIKAVGADSRYDKIPILAISRISEKEYMRKVMALGIFDYLIKPIDVNVLAQKLRPLFDIDEKFFQEFKLIPLSPTLADCQFLLNSTWISLKEEGLVVDLDYYLAPKTAVKIEHPLLKRILNIKGPVTCFLSEIERKQGGGHRAFFSFDALDSETIAKVRFWIYHQTLH